MSTDRLAVFAAVLGILLAVHGIGDHWIQTCRQAVDKSTPGWPGRLACVRHIATYTLVCLAALAALAWRTGLHLDLTNVALGLTINALTHYVADRREPLRRLARLLGNNGYLDHTTVVRKPGEAPDTTGPGTALFHLDGSWHLAWLAVTALIIA